MMKHVTQICTFMLGLVFLFAGGCHPAPKGRSTVMMPRRIITQEQWSEAEQSQNKAKHDLRMNRVVSYHMIRLAGAEPLHVHDRHDVAVTIISGRVMMRLGPKTMEVGQGDVIVIPRGMPHSAENLDPKHAAEAFAAFSPPFEQDDFRVVESR